MLLSLKLQIAIAVYDPQTQANNRFGIHIIEQSDIENAAKLVNSNGGKWGYITLVIREDQREVNQWYDFFKNLRSKHLIPIVRIATHVEGASWVKPKKEDAKSWASFLNQLPWPTNNRYIIIFNEPNHAKEWGDEINPKEYAEILSEYSHKLKVESHEFFVLNAGFDMAASNIEGETADALWYISEMDKENPGIFNAIDGWTSHSYPNPGFSADPYKIGRTSIVSYRFEQEYLRSNFSVPTKAVFVTETGWVSGPNGLSEETVSSYYKIAFREIWNDENLVAVTPFLLNYPEDLFASFSWIDKEGNYKKQYGSVLAMTKEAGEPKLNPITYFGKFLKTLKEPLPKLSYVPDLVF